MVHSGRLSRTSSQDVNIADGPHLDRRKQIGLQLLAPVVMLAFGWTIPESPRW